MIVPVACHDVCDSAAWVGSPGSICSHVATGHTLVKLMFATIRAICCLLISSMQC